MRTIARRSWNWHPVLVLAFSMLIMGSDPAAAQTGDGAVHLAKEIYADMANWEATAPGAVELKNFMPFRAVYERHYRDANGQPRKDRVVISAEHVAWGEDAAIMVGLIDAGSLDYTDTSARSQIRYFTADDLRLLLQITPVTGTAKDYTLIRMEGGAAHMTSVKTATGESEHREMANAPPGFGAPGPWLWGSMSLEEGMRIRFDPYYASASSNVLGAAPSRVIGRETIEMPDGEAHEAWVLERPLGMTGPRFMRTYVIDRPPYFLGKTPVDVDTGERPEVGSMRLLEFQTFSNQP